jgi:hypothetical protein
MKKYIYIALSMVLGFCGLAACGGSSDNNQTGNVTTTELSVAADGGNQEITVDGSSWTIAGVENISGTITKDVIGNIYDVKGTLLNDSVSLKLTGLGILKSLTKYTGFTITRTSDTSISIAMNENLTTSVFKISIILKSGNETKKINITQPQTGGYSYVDLDYSIVDAVDVDSTYLDSLTAYSTKTTFVKISPIIDFDTSSFTSTDPLAFLWTTDTPSAKVPYAISNKTLVFNGTTFPYSEATQDVRKIIYSDYQSIETPSGKNKCVVWVEKRKVTANFKLTLKANATSKTREVKGKWVGIYTTGKYQLKWIYDNSVTTSSIKHRI